MASAGDSCPRKQFEAASEFYLAPPINRSAQLPCFERATQFQSKLGSGVECLDLI
jgi:hypothetical protein